MLFISNPAAFLPCKNFAFGNLKCFDVVLFCFEVAIFLQMKDDFQHISTFTYINTKSTKHKSVLNVFILFYRF